MTADGRNGSGRMVLDLCFAANEGLLSNLDAQQPFEKSGQFPSLGGLDAFFSLEDYYKDVPFFVHTP